MKLWHSLEIVIKSLESCLVINLLQSKRIFDYLLGEKSRIEVLKSYFY